MSRRRETVSSRPRQASQSAGRPGSWAVRSVDLTDENIAAIAASEMAQGFEHLNAEVDDT